MTAPTVPIEKLRPAEKRLVEEGGSGVYVRFKRSAPKDDRTIRASVLRDFLLGRYGSSTSADFDPTGVCLARAVIKGPLNISGFDLAFPLRFVHCHFARVRAKQFRGTCLILRHCTLTGSLDLDGCHVTGEVDLRKSTFQKQVSVRNARIEGVFVATKTSFEFDTSTTDVAIEIEEDKDLIEKSEVRARLAKFASLNLDESEVSGSIVLTRAKFKGSLFMRGAHTDRSLILAGAQLQCSHPIAWLATGLRVDGDLLTKEAFVAKGVVRLLGATISGDWDCENGKFLHAGEQCLNADGIEIGGGLYMRKDFQASGGVVLRGANIGGQLDCTGAKFMGEGEHCLQADSISIAGSLFMDKFLANGQVNLMFAKVGVQWSCKDGKFMGKDEHCLIADWIDVKGDLHMHYKFGAAGVVSLYGAKIGKKANISLGASVVSIDLSDAEVKGSLALFDLRKNDIDISSSSFDVLNSTPENSTPSIAKFDLIGLTYNDIEVHVQSENEETDSVVDKLISMLDRSSNKEHYPQPYRQLIRTLREHGYHDEAIQVAIAKRSKNSAAKNPGLRSPLRLFSWLNKVLTGYGYRPGRVLGLWIAVMFVAGVTYTKLGVKDVMAPSEGDVLVWQQEERAKQEQGLEEGRQVKQGQEEEMPLPNGYPPYIPWLYAVDEFIPIIDLGQADRYRPSPERSGDSRVVFGPWSWNTGRFLIYVDAVLDLLGWLLASLLIAAYSGLIRQAGRDE